MHICRRALLSQSRPVSAWTHEAEESAAVGKVGASYVGIAAVERPAGQVLTLTRL